MRRLRLASLIACIVIVPRLASAQFGSIWVHNYDGGLHGYDYGTDLSYSSNGYIYVSGTTTDSNSTGDIVLMKYTLAGDQVWAIEPNNSQTQWDYVWDIESDTSGSLYAAGVTYVSPYIQATLSKRNPNGTLAWERQSNILSTPYGWEAMALSGAGHVYVMGGGSDGPDYGLVLAKYSTAGDSVWWSFLGLPEYYESADFGYKPLRFLRLGPTGDIYCAAQISNAGNFNILTARFSTSGDTVWTRRFDGPDGGVDRLSGFAVDGSGNAYLTGSTTISGNENFLTLKYAANGVLLWSRTYDGTGSGYDRGWALAVDVNGDVIVTGTSRDTNSTSDAFTIKYSASGDSLWADRYRDIAAWEYHEGNGIVLDPSGDAYVTGSGIVAGDAGALFLHYDGLTGSRLDFVSDASAIGGGLVGTSIVVGDPGSLYAVGSGVFNVDNSRDILLVKYGIVTTDVREVGGETVPRSSELQQNYPNPFNSSTTIRFDLPSVGPVDLTIMDILGHTIRRFHEPHLEAGTYSLVWDGRNEVGETAASGIYFYRLETSRTTEVKKMVLLK